MDWNATNAGFVMASYGLSAVVLIAIAGAIIWRDIVEQRLVKVLQKNQDPPL